MHACFDHGEPRIVYGRLEIPEPGSSQTHVMYSIAYRY